MIIILSITTFVFQLYVCPCLFQFRNQRMASVVIRADIRLTSRLTKQITVCICMRYRIIRSDDAGLFNMITVWTC